ncbi:terpene synthase, partial [Amycolatopsis sp. NPDC000673]
MSGIAAVRPDLAFAGPLGLGTSAARIAEQFAPRSAPPPGQDPAYAEREWGDGSASPLYCPAVRRVNE